MTSIMTPLIKLIRGDSLIELKLIPDNSVDSIVTDPPYELGFMGKGWDNSGPHARPMHPDWAKSVRDQCQEVGVPFFFKQWGEYLFPSQWIEAFGGEYEPEKDMDNVPHHWRVGKKAAGRLLDGREWNEFPENKETK